MGDHGEVDNPYNVFFESSFAVDNGTPVVVSLFSATATRFFVRVIMLLYVHSLLVLKEKFPRKGGGLLLIDGWLTIARVTRRAFCL